MLRRGATSKAKVVAHIEINSKIDKQDLNKRLSKTLPNLALPKKYVHVPEFPRMGSGKTDFRTLTEIVRQLDEQD